MVFSGRALLINGHLYYSPNSTRTIGLPPIPSITEGNLNPFLYGATWRTLLQPQRWTTVFGWACFMPLTRRAWDSLPFSALSHLPRPQFNDELCTMDTATTNAWNCLDRMVFEVAFSLRSYCDSNIVLPATPRAKFPYDKQYRSQKKCQYMIHNSREWFLVWMGALSYLIAFAESGSDHIRLRDQLEYQLQGWQQHLCQSPHLIDFVEQLAGSSCTEPCMPRVGIIVDLMKKHEPDEPHAEWFLAHQIPLWYSWGPETASYAKRQGLYHLMPPPEALQALQFTTYHTPHSPPPFASEDPLPSPPNLSTASSSYEDNANARHRAILDILEEYAAAVRKKRSSPSWTALEEERAANRARDLGVSSARVIVYEVDENDPSKLVKNVISNAHKVDTHGDFEEAEREFFPELNVWVCCDDMVVTKLTGRLDFDDEEEDGAITETPLDTPLDLPAIPFTPQIPSQQIEISTVIPEDFEDSFSGSEGPSRLEQHALHILRYFYGYTSPIPYPTATGTHTFDKKAQAIFLHSLGIHPSTPASADFCATAIAKDMHNFYFEGCVKDSVSVTSYDFHLGNPDYIAHQPKCRMVVVPSTTINPALRNANFKPWWFIFNDEAGPWKLAVATALDALTVVRLRRNGHSYEDIAARFARLGVRFQTLQAVRQQVRIRYHPIPTRIPSRTEGYVFSLKDYHAYLHQRSMMLGHPRARAFLMRGGIIWRLVANDVEPEQVLDGPSHSSSNLSIVDPFSSEQMIDDSLSEVEEALMVGAYNCFTGNGRQAAIKSWWPLASMFELGEDWGRWTGYHENWFLTRLKQIEAGEAQPLNKVQWRTFLKGRSETRTVRAKLESRARKFIPRAFPNSCSHLETGEL